MVVFKSDDGRKRSIRDYTNKISKKYKDMEKNENPRCYEINGKIMMYDNKRFHLSEDQVNWLTKFKKLNLADWRYECLFDMKYPDFVYVGEGCKDENRTANLEIDQYYYWPKDDKIKEKH